MMKAIAWLQHASAQAHAVCGIEGSMSISAFTKYPNMSGHSLHGTYGVWCRNSGKWQDLTSKFILNILRRRSYVLCVFFDFMKMSALSSVYWIDRISFSHCLCVSSNTCLTLFTVLTKVSNVSACDGHECNINRLREEHWNLHTHSRNHLVSNKTNVSATLWSWSSYWIIFVRMSNALFICLILCYLSSNDWEATFKR